MKIIIFYEILLFKKYEFFLFLNFVMKLVIFSLKYFALKMYDKIFIEIKILRFSCVFLSGQVFVRKQGIVEIQFEYSNL